MPDAGLSLHRRAVDPGDLGRRQAAAVVSGVVVRRRGEFRIETRPRRACQLERRDGWSSGGERWAVADTQHLDIFILWSVLFYIYTGLFVQSALKPYFCEFLNIFFL